MSLCMPLTFQFSDLPRRQASLSRLVSWSSTSLLIVTGTLIVLLAVVILVYENTNATRGYRLRTLERERTQLLLSREVLNMEIAEQQALDHLVTDPKIVGMEEVRGQKYVNPLPSVAGEL